MNPEPTSFLYPFIDSEETDMAGLVADLARSAQAKLESSAAIRAATVAAGRSYIDAAGAALADRLSAGGRLLAFGNGGSATDADGAVELWCHPPWGLPLPALSLVDDGAVLTALANDIGFESVLARQVIAYAREGDAAMGFSTSGDSLNVLKALEEAHRRGVLTIGLSGYEGGAMASSDAVDHLFVVRSDSVHRIQEAQDAVVLELWRAVQARLAGAGDGPQ